MSESSHLRISSWFCDPQQIFPNCPQPELLRSFALCGAQRKLAISVPDGDAPTMLVKKSSLAKSMVHCCSVHLTVVWNSDPELGFLSNTAADAALRVFTSGRWFLLCALTCTDAGGPSATPTSCRCWISAAIVTSRTDVRFCAPRFDHCSMRKWLDISQFNNAKRFCLLQIFKKRWI